MRSHTSIGSAVAVRSGHAVSALCASDRSVTATSDARAILVRAFACMARGPDNSRLETNRWSPP